MLIFNLDMIQSIGLAILLLLIGRKFRKRFKILEKYCIPSPVVGGLLFAILTLVLRQLNILEFKFDDILQKFFMTMFFTSVGFNASLKVLKKRWYTSFYFFNSFCRTYFCTKYSSNSICY